MQVITKTVQEGDRVIRQQLWKPDVPSGYDVRLLLDYLSDYDDFKVALGGIIVTCARPAELCGWNWQRITYDETTRDITTIYHDVYKPRNTVGKAGTITTYKEVKKHITSQYITLPNGRQKMIKYSPWYSQQLIGYKKRGSTYKNGKVFCWNEGSSIRKNWTRMRNQMRLDLANGKISEDYKAWLDTDKQIIFGGGTGGYRLDMYSLRRFAITFLHWAIFKGDAVKTASYVGHSDPTTTLSHYVRPKEAIGLTQEMIDKNIGIDEFILMAGKQQTRIVEFEKNWKEPMLAAGQRSLMDFPTIDAPIHEASTYLCSSSEDDDP